MDQLMPADTINKEVEEGSPTLLGCEILKLDDKEKTMTNLDEEEENIESTTPRSKMGSNDVNAPIETSST